MENFQETYSASYSDLSSSSILFRAPDPIKCNNYPKTFDGSDSTNSLQSSSSSILYSEIKKPNKRVCFWDDVTTTTTTTTTTSSEEFDENWTPSASPSKFPKTNPHFKIPQRNCEGTTTGFAAIKQLAHRPASCLSVSSTYSTDATNESEQTLTSSTSADSDESRVRNNEDPKMRRIVAGLKGFGIKGANLYFLTKYR